MKSYLSAVMLLLAAQVVQADQIVLKNGDRLTGTIVKSDTKELLLETPTAAKVTIQWDSIATITADGPVYVDTSDDQTIAGAVRTDNNQLIVTTRTVGTVTVPFANVRGLRNQTEQVAHETEVDRLRNPRLIDLWGGFLDVGYATARGNADTQTFTLNTRADRSTNRDKISVFFTSIFAANSTNGPRETTANSKIGGVIYDLNLTPKWFAWGATTLESDQFQELDLRFVPAGGIGHHTINTENTKLDLRVGVSYNREFFSTGLDRNSVEIVLGNDFTHNFSKTTSLQQHLRLYPNASNGAFRMNFDTTFAAALAKWLSLQVSFIDRYLSNPVPGRKTNDMLISAGVRFSFAQ